MIKILIFSISEVLDPLSIIKSTPSLQLQQLVLRLHHMCENEGENDHH
jgi:hypothetical protein